MTTVAPEDQAAPITTPGGNSSHDIEDQLLQQLGLMQKEAEQPQQPPQHHHHEQHVPHQAKPKPHHHKPSQPQRQKHKPQQPQRPSNSEEDVFDILFQIEADVQRIRPSQRIRRSDPATPTDAGDAAQSPVRTSTLRPMRKKIVRQGRPRNATTTPPTAGVVTSPTYDDIKSNFSCAGRVIGGLYADVESGCRLFHICAQGKKNR